MSKEKWRVPKLRFPGFTEDWEQRKLSDILKVNSGKDYKHLEQGDIPVYGTGGYMLSVNESLSNIDAIGIGRKGTIDKPQYLKAPFWTVDTLFYLTALDKHSILFLYYLMQLMPWKKFDESTGVPSLSKTTIDNINGYVPSNPKEEELISALFNQLDKSITLHQRKLNNLKLKKKALLQKLFPKNGERYPELRFPGFTDAWEQRKLGEYANFRRGSFPQPYGNKEWYDGVDSAPFVQVVDVGDNLSLVDCTKQRISKLAQPMSVYAEKGSVLVTLQGSIGRVAVSQYDAFIDRTILIFQGYKYKTNPYFWAYIIKGKFSEEALKAPGGTIKTITKEALSNFIILYPKFSEQEQIGSFFEKLDKLITLHQRKLDHLQLQKKALLQQIFV